jgi:hypothetical protein
LLVGLARRVNASGELIGEIDLPSDELRLVKKDLDVNAWCTPRIPSGIDAFGIGVPDIDARFVDSDFVAVMPSRKRKCLNLKRFGKE